MFNEITIFQKGAIDNLPDEILGHIFLFNTEKDAYSERQYSHDPHSTTLTTILVCKRWYMVGLSYGALWSRIIDYEQHSPAWIEELLTRSKPTPLDIGEDTAFNFIQLRKSRALSVLELLFQQATRIRTLSLQIQIAPWTYICMHFLQNPAPVLEYLNLITSCPFPDCLYPGPLFSNSAPKLRRVHIQRCLIDFSSTALHNLTELSVLNILAPIILATRRPDHPLKVAPTVAGWITILKNMPSLKYLTLDNTITPSLNDNSIPTIQLPNLVLLSVGARFQDGVALLDHLTTPRTCGIRLRLNCNKANATLDSTKLLSFLGNRLAHWSDDVTERYIQAKILSGDRIHFGNYRRIGFPWNMTEAAVVEEHSKTSVDPLLWLVLSLDSSQDAVTLFNQLLSLYGPTYHNTTTLDLWLDEEFTVNPSPTVRPALNSIHSFSTLKSLNLIARSPTYLLPLLQSTSLPDLPVLPALRSLILTRSDFEDQQRTVYLSVLHFLKYRSQIHFPLTDLQLIEGKISKETEDSLAHIGAVTVTLSTPRQRPVDVSSEQTGA